MQLQVVMLRHVLVPKDIIEHTFLSPFRFWLGAGMLCLLHSAPFVMAS